MLYVWPAVIANKPDGPAAGRSSVIAVYKLIVAARHVVVERTGILCASAANVHCVARNKRAGRCRGVSTSTTTANGQVSRAGHCAANLHIPRCAHTSCAVPIQRHTSGADVGNDHKAVNDEVRARTKGNYIANHLRSKATCHASDGRRHACSGNISKRQLRTVLVSIICAGTRYSRIESPSVGQSSTGTHIPTGCVICESGGQFKGFL